MRRYELCGKLPVLIVHPEAGEFILLPDSTLLTKSFRRLTEEEARGVPFGDQWRSSRGRVTISLTGEDGENAWENAWENVWGSEWGSEAETTGK